MRILALLIVGLLNVPAIGDTITYWPATRQRVYVVDAKNIGPYGTIRKPAGIDVIVIRHGNRWGPVRRCRLCNPFCAPVGLRHGSRI